MAHGVQDAFSQGEVQLSFDLIRQIARAHGAAKIQIETRTRPEDLQFCLESPFQRAGGKFFSLLSFREYIANLNDRCVDFFFNRLQFPS